MFRRRDSAQAEAPAADASQALAEPARPGVTPGKGRPTPKRSEAERRRGPYSAPRDRKAAGTDYRARQRADRARRYAAMQRGEDWALPAKDRGPVRALARDFVDSRRRLSEFYMYAVFVLLLIMFFIKNVALQSSVVPGLVIVMILAMVIEGIFLGRKIRKLAAERLPGESTRGIALYSAMRALQIRRLRVPKPRVKPGDKI